MAKPFRTLAEMRQYPCRTCGAKPGEFCRTIASATRTSPHQSRWEPQYGGDFADDEKPVPPRVYSFTRDQLIEALGTPEMWPLAATLSVGIPAGAESMADALIEALEGGAHA